MDDDELDGRLARAARPLPHAAPGTFDALARDARAEGRRLRRRRLILGVSGGLLALAAGIIAAPAAADGIEQLFAARTDEVCIGTECGADDGGSFIDPSASDFDDLVHSVYPDYLELPPGMTPGDIEHAVVVRIASTGGVTLDTGIGQQYENIAFCGWIAEWLDADDDGDDGRRSTAAGVIRRSIDWPAMSDSVADDVWFTVQDSFADAAEQGDRTGVLAGGSVNACGQEQDAAVSEWLEDMAAERL